MTNRCTPNVIKVECIYSEDSEFIKGNFYNMTKGFDNLYTISGEEGGYGSWASIKEMNEDFEGSYIFK